MFWSQMVLRRWCFVLFLLCSPVPHHGRPADGRSSRTSRSVAHTQLMHDKGRTLQDFKRRMWLQELLDDVHTADIRELALRTTGAAGAPSGGPPPRAPAGAKDAALAFQPEDQEGTKLPQESQQSTGHKDGGGLLRLPDRKKKKVRSGKRRDGEKRRRGRSLGWLKKDPGRGLRLEWRPLLGGL